MNLSVTYYLLFWTNCKFPQDISMLVADLSSARSTHQRSTMGKEIYPSQENWSSRNRTPSERPSAPQANQCLLSHIPFVIASLGLQGKTNCTSMLESIDSCQNRVSADQYHLTVSRAQVSTHLGRVFFVIRWQVTSFQMIAGTSFF